MADGTPGTPPTPPPVIDDPMLEVLTFDQLAQLVNEVIPDAFYQRAAAFDQAAARLQDVLDQIRHQLNHVQEVWTGGVSEDFDNLAREVAGRVTVVLQFLQNPGYGSILRTAGDVLAAHQQRFRDLQGQKAQQESAPPAAGAPPPEVTAQVNDQSAKQILRDLRTAYQDIGNAIAPLPYTTPQVIATPARAVPPAGDAAPVVVVAPSEFPGAAVQGVASWGAVAPVAARLGVPGAGGPFGFGELAGQALGREPVDQLPAGAVPAAAETTPVVADARSGFPGVADQGVAPGGPMALPLGAPGAGPFGFGGPPEWVLGRGEPVCQLPAGPESGLDPATEPAVLGQTWSAPLPMSHVGAVGVVGVSPAVLGRPERQSDTWRTDKAADKVGGRDRKAAEEVCQPLPQNHPETASGEAAIAPSQDTDAGTVKTTADAPQTTAPLATDAARQVATPLATDAARQVAASAQSSPAGHSAPAMDLNAVAKSLFAVTASSGDATTAAGPTPPAAWQMDPQERGMFVPTAGAAAGGDAPQSAGQPPTDPATGPLMDPAARSHSAHGGAAGPADPSASSGYPMSPMMFGGMSGQSSQQNGRMAAVPNEPRPEVWDSSNGTPTALGRPEPSPEDREPELSQADAQALLAAKLAELDRLVERGN